MGLEIKKNEDDLYQLTSTNSGESYHPDKKWITEDEVKILLINEAFSNFVEKCIKIDMTFPNGYVINDLYKHDKSKPDFNQWMLNFGLKDSIHIKQKFEELYDRLKLYFIIP